MNKNVLIAFGGAMLIAILVAVMMSAMLKGGKKEKKEMAEVPSVQILVATQSLAIGDLITPQNVKWKTWPGDGVFPGTIQRAEKQKLDEVAKGRSIRAIAVDEPILESAIVGDDAGFMAAKLKKGMRAIAVNTKPNTIVAGFINPGDYVDVILTYSARVRAQSNNEALESEMERLIGMNLQRYASETVLRNVLVLGIDQRADLTAKPEKDAKASAKIGKTVTLETDERGAEIIALAAKMGEITLALRPLGDANTTDDGHPTVSDARLISINKELDKQLSTIEETSGSSNRNVRIYNGGVVTNQPVR